MANVIRRNCEWQDTQKHIETGSCGNPLGKPYTIGPRKQSRSKIHTQPDRPKTIMEAHVKPITNGTHRTPFCETAHERAR